MKVARYSYPAIVAVIPGDKTREAKAIPKVRAADYNATVGKTMVVIAADPSWKPQDKARAMTAFRKAFVHVAGKVLVMEYFRAKQDVPVDELWR